MVRPIASLLIAAALCLGAAAQPPAPNPRPVLPQVRVNTLWVVPELNLSWVEPLIVVRKPGGSRYQIDSNISEFSIARSLREAVEFLRLSPARAPGFAEAYAEHDLYFRWEDEDQPRGGPSAGLAFAVGAYGAMVGLPIQSDVAFTGAVDSEGNVGAVAGLPLKIKASRDGTMRVLVLPTADRVKPADLETRLCEELRVVQVARVEDAFFEAFGLQGPRAREYDALLNAWADYRRAKLARNHVGARIALDTALDLQPGDLSAQRLLQSYSRVNMKPAAAALFADAQTYDRDGLPDEALRAVRRAWQYADQPLRDQHAELRERLERNALSADDRDLLAASREAELEGDAITAYRLLAGLAARLPQNSYVADLVGRWPPMQELLATAQAAQARPDDVLLNVQLAEGFTQRALYESAARTYAHLSALEPGSSRWPLAEAEAWHRAERPAQVADVLRGLAGAYPTEAALAQVRLGVELVAPKLTAGPWRAEPGRLLTAIEAADGSGEPVLTAALDGGPALAAQTATSQLAVATGRLAVGRHEVTVVASDPFGNQASLPLSFEVTAQDTAPACLTASAAAPTVTASPDPLPLDPRRAGPTLVAAGSRLRLDGGDLFGLAELTSVSAGAATATEPPFALDLVVAAGDQNVALTATQANGAPLTGPPLQLTGTDQPPVWLLAPTDGQTIAGLVPIVAAAADAPAGAVLTAVVDGIAVATSPADQPLLIDTAALPVGVHQIGVLLDTGQVRRLSPTVGVQVLGPVADAGQAQVAGDDLPVNLALSDLTAGAVPPPGLASPPVPHLAWLAPSEPQPTLAAADLALLLDAPPKPSLTHLQFALGDAVAWLTEPAELNALATETRRTSQDHFVWRPTRAGTWRVSVGGLPLLVSFSGVPALALRGPAPGSTWRRPFGLQVSAAPGQVGGQLWLDNQLVGAWAEAGAVLTLNPADYEPGWHVLRASAQSPDGPLVVSPPLPLIFEAP